MDRPQAHQYGGPEDNEHYYKQKEMDDYVLLLEYEREAAAALFDERVRRLEAQNKFLWAALYKIAEAESMGYGTQRTYGQMAQSAIDKYGRLT